MAMTDEAWSGGCLPARKGAALVVEGGALRGVFSTGVLDGFLEAGFHPFDFFIGVSSGASNLAAYLAGMKGRNRKIYLDYSLRPEFISLARFLRGGHLMDLDWLWEITIREICPPDGFRVSRLSRDPRILQEGYGQGRTLAAEAVARWEKA